MVEAMSNKDQCPFCENMSLRTLDSRPCANANVVRKRRKECETCKKRFTTHEIVVDEKGIGQQQTARDIIRFVDRVETAARDVFGDDLRIKNPKIGRWQ